MNRLNKGRQIQAISALTEGSSIRSVERITGIHRDTIMRLGIRIGQACEKYMDENMVDLPCKRIQVDEIWGFVGKKDKQVKGDDKAKGLGNAWTFVAIDADTKLVPAFMVGGRDPETAKAFIQDLSDRMTNRIQLSSDSLPAYITAVREEFGNAVDYAQIVKSFTANEEIVQGKYSPGTIVNIVKYPMIGRPAEKHISTSFVERQNLTMRMHCRRLTRLTNAFSKKLENFKAAVGLHFGYYNLVKIHNTLRITPAMAAGVENKVWSIGDLIDLAN